MASDERDWRIRLIFGYVPEQNASLADPLEDHRQDESQSGKFALAGTSDNGNPIGETSAADAIDHFRYFAPAVRAQVPAGGRRSLLDNGRERCSEICAVARVPERC
jgi:hypothetical protein